MKIIPHRASQRTVSHESRVLAFTLRASSRAAEQRIATLEQRIAATRALIARLQTPSEQREPISSLFAAVEHVLDTCEQLDRDLGRKVQSVKYEYLSKHTPTQPYELLVPTDKA